MTWLRNTRWRGLCRTSKFIISFLFDIMILSTLLRSRLVSVGQGMLLAVDSFVTHCSDIISEMSTTTNEPAIKGDHQISGSHVCDLFSSQDDIEWTWWSCQDMDCWESTFRWALSPPSGRVLDSNSRVWLCIGCCACHPCPLGFGSHCSRLHPTFNLWSGHP